MGAGDGGDVEFGNDVSGIFMRSMVFHSCIDQGSLHVMGCQIEPLIILKKLLGIALQINRFSHIDE